MGHVLLSMLEDESIKLCATEESHAILNPAHFRDAYDRAYENFISSMPSQDLWVKTRNPTIKLLVYHKQARRPKKSRMRGIYEIPKEYVAKKGIMQLIVVEMIEKGKLAIHKGQGKLERGEVEGQGKL
ncbi:unnamed protein product [Prunus armeniaca]|uniref:Uncharacterized protein n=1 Tax=Prunus armeniaca TaxID=36596 RepID=A0A6J5V3M0_PRUAR|nr:unnamed protein product [Prunus armeniaca]